MKAKRDNSNRKLCAEMTLFRTPQESRSCLGEQLLKSVPYRVRLYADFEAIMRALAESAYRAKGGHASMCYGALRVTVEEIKGEK